MNPLLSDAPLPDFERIRPEHVTPAIDHLLAQAEAALDAATHDDLGANYGALAKALDPAIERLLRVWNLVGHLHAVIDTPALRTVYNDNLPRIVEFTTRLGSDRRLYDKTRRIAAEQANDLSTLQTKAVRDRLRDFVLGGAELEGAAHARFGAVQARLAELSMRFGENVLDATDAWSMTVTEPEMSGVPNDVRAQAKADATAHGADDAYRLTLQGPCREAVLRHATHRPLREAVFRAKAALCTDRGPQAQDNGALILETLQLRQEQASLLGHPTYADLSLVAKMATSPQEVTAFLRTLAARARPYAVAELERLQAFSTQELGLDKLQPWDMDFAAERLKQALHGLDDEQLRAYFPLPRVLTGLMALIASLFEVRFVALPGRSWHADVQTFEVIRDEERIGLLCLDLFARSGKQSGAWMDEARSRWRRCDDDSLQLPLAHLVCNFAAPIDGRACLLTHDQLITLFHEFGHGLHHLLTRIDELSLSGISGVEWDAAELPSQFMENFCWDFDVLQDLSAHVDDDRPLPRELFDRLVGARHFGAGLQLLRHIEFALFDMEAHLADRGLRDVGALVSAVRKDVSVLADPLTAAYPNTFTHIFDGGYAAGYYGYAWAEVLASDAFELFEEKGLRDASTARRWRESVLETGASRPSIENFVAFRGRPPLMHAFLRHHGLLEPQAAVG